MLKKSQSAVEFIVLGSFMFLVMLTVLTTISSNVIDAKEESNKKIAADIAGFVYREIEIAKSVKDGYIRVFYVPQTVNGVNYTINVVDSRELTVNYLNNEHVSFLPPNVTGNLSKGFNQIMKIDSIIYLSATEPVLECNDGVDNDLDTKIDLIDAGCAGSSDADETDCGDTSCEGGESCSTCASDCGACPLPGIFFMRNSQYTITSPGTPVALITSPTGSGSKNLNTIKDGVKPPVGSSGNNLLQYDTFNGLTRTQDWIGYTYSSPQTFNRILFQEGIHFGNGGWFAGSSLTVQVRQSGVWNPVSGLTISPNYPGINNGVNYESFNLNFNPISGDGIRIFGTPGGAMTFISVAELEVYAPSVISIVSFADDGNAVLKGALQENSNPLATSNDEFIVKDSGGGNAAVIDLASGDMAIKGNLQQNQPVLNPPPTNNLVIKNSNGLIISYIDESGNFVLRGSLTQNGNP